MGGSGWVGIVVPPPSIAPASSGATDRDEHWKNFDSSVNAVSFGFVATAILISMFVVMAIFERFFRSRSTAPGGQNRVDLEAQLRVSEKLNHPSPKMSVYGKGVSVLMPGEEVPTFIAHLAPTPCPREFIVPSSGHPSRHHYQQQQQQQQQPATTTSSSC